MTVRFEEQFIVVVFDVCSSSSIMDDLLLSEKFANYERFLGCMKRWLFDQLKLGELKSHRFKLYKFTGDGWILLFPPEISGVSLVSFIRGLCECVEGELARHILPYLNGDPPQLGVTIGVDRGYLVKIKMRSQDEYVGRPLNIACRLQNAVKDEIPYGYKALISNPVFNEYFQDNPYKTASVTCVLKNLNGGKSFKCWKIDFTLDGSEQPVPFPKCGPPGSDTGMCARSLPRVK